mmetsp:Transcript_110333/g.351698  ORF Transcript_110333/g.351698 Transcript_110333/m.351698 type:complete len:243 (+) Transcript_110333:661-1389(+)
MTQLRLTRSAARSPAGGARAKCRTPAAMDAEGTEKCWAAPVGCSSSRRSPATVPTTRAPTPGPRARRRGPGALGATRNSPRNCGLSLSAVSFRGTISEATRSEAARAQHPVPTPRTTHNTPAANPTRHRAEHLNSVGCNTQAAAGRIPPKAPPGSHLRRAGQPRRERPRSRRLSPTSSLGPQDCPPRSRRRPTMLHCLPHGRSVAQRLRKVGAASSNPKPRPSSKPTAPATTAVEVVWSGKT